MDEIIIKKANSNINYELETIKFDSSYIDIASDKYKGASYKLFNLKPYEANILKQLCLSLGFDCAVSRDTVTCNCDYTDAVIFASNSQIKNLCEKLKFQPFRLQKISEIFQNIIKSTMPPLVLANTAFDWSRPYIMGILNVTPDSFSDGGQYFDENSAYNHALELIDDGADIIDIGGESTRPDAQTVSVEEEIKRVVPVIKKIRSQGINIPISVDTMNYKTAEAAIEAGADIINDVSGLDYDNNLMNYVVTNNVPTIIMHSDKIPAESCDFTTSDVVEQVYFILNNKINKLTAMGLNRSKIIADTGIGFGKSPKACFELIKRHYEFKTLNVPMLLGISRKSFITKTFSISAKEADLQTALYSTLAKNVHIHRVHNVKLTKQYLEYTKPLL